MRVKAKRVDDHAGHPYGVRWDCPGCDAPHVVPTHIPNSWGKAWGFNGDYNRPTLTPSILIYPAPNMRDDGTVYQTPRCHSFVRDGRIEFCGDSTHALAGQTVDMPEIEGE